MCWGKKNDILLYFLRREILILWQIRRALYFSLVILVATRIAGLALATRIAGLVDLRIFWGASYQQKYCNSRLIAKNAILVGVQWTLFIFKKWWSQKPRSTLACTPCPAVIGKPLFKMCCFHMCVCVCVCVKACPDSLEHFFCTSKCTNSCFGGVRTLARMVCALFSSFWQRKTTDDKKGLKKVLHGAV